MEDHVAYRESSNVAHEHVEEDDEQQAKSSAFAAGGLSVHFGERERPTAVDDSVKISDAVQDCNGIAECCK